MTILLTFILILTYFYLRGVWFSNRKILHTAQVERVSLCTFQPDIIVPEVKISYKYYFGGGIYTGEGFLFVSHFLGEKDYQIYFNKLLIPVLETEGEVLVSEEHIETYLLSKMDTVPIHLDPIEPYRSKLLYTINQTQDTRNKTQ